MEYFDLINELGNPLGKKKLRSEVHRDGDWHRAIDVWVVTDVDKVLLQKRAATKESYPNLWEISCSGHISAGENSLDSAVRELKEELGIDVQAADLEFIFVSKEEHITNNGSFINREIKDTYLLKLNFNIADLVLQADEVAAVKLIPIDELKENIKFHPADFVPHRESYQKFFDYFETNFHNKSKIDIMESK